MKTVVLEEASLKGKRQKPTARRARERATGGDEKFTDQTYVRPSTCICTTSKESNVQTVKSKRRRITSPEFVRAAES